MAFQCYDCYANKDDFEMAGNWGRSKGPCENCGYTRVCVDRPFNVDKNWKNNLRQTFTAANLPVPDDLK